MTKDRKESTKKQIKKTKPNENPTKTSLDTFLKSQQNVVNQLKTDVKNSEMELQKSASLIEEKNKCIAGLEINLQKRDSEIEMLNNSLKALKEENMQTLKDFSTFRDKFHDLECRYDKYSQILKDEHQELTDKFHKQQIEANNKIQELNYGYKDVQQQLLEKSQAVMKLNEQLLETMRTFEQMKTDFGRQQNDFALYKTKVEEEKRIYEENNKVEFAKLKDKLVHKDEIIKQCVFDKNNLEEEKNRIIEELNHKIRSIERAFTQPTSVVQPMSSTSKPTNEISSNQNITENLFDNVAITRPQVREPVENTSNVQTTTNNENNNSSDSTPPQRQYKFKRPTQVPISHNSTAASTSNANNNNIKKRRQPVRQQTAKLNLPATAMFNEFSSSSNEDDESDGDVSFIKATQWRPTRPRDMSVQITKKQKTVDKIPQGKLELHSESQLYGKECKNEKMRLLCDEVYCREQNYNYALENSNKITQVVACLLAGVFKKEAIINSTVIGQNSNMLGNEHQMQNSQCLDSTAKSAIIAFSKDYGEKQGWPPQADSEIIISMNDSLRKLQCLYKMKNEIKI